MNQVVCLTVSGAAFIPFSHKQYLLLLFVLCWGLVSALHKVTTDITHTLLPLNANWLWRAMIFARSGNLAFLDSCIKSSPSIQYLINIFWRLFSDFCHVHRFFMDINVFYFECSSIYRDQNADLFCRQPFNIVEQINIDSWVLESSLRLKST